jgi:hypothetical protein
MFEGLLCSIFGLIEVNSTFMEKDNKRETSKKEKEKPI